MPAATATALRRAAIARAGRDGAGRCCRAPGLAAQPAAASSRRRAPSSVRRLACCKAPRTSRSIALGLIGVDYRYGGSSPEHGLDCSGLVRYVFQQVDRRHAAAHGAGK